MARQKKPASYLHRTAQPHTLAIFRSWGSSAGAGRIRLAGCKYRKMRRNNLLLKLLIVELVTIEQRLSTRQQEEIAWNAVLNY